MTYSCGTPLLHIMHAQNIVDILSLINDIFNQVVPENNPNLNGQVQT